MDNVSRSFGFNILTTKTDNTDTVSDYEADRITLEYSYGLPMTEDNRFNLSLRYMNWNVETTTNSPTEIVNFVSDNGDEFDNFSFLVSYAIDTRDSARFTRSGFKTSLSTEVFVPGSDLEYYKVQFKTDSYFDINRKRDIVLSCLLYTSDAADE